MYRVASIGALALSLATGVTLSARAEPDQIRSDDLRLALSKAAARAPVEPPPLPEKAEPVNQSAPAATAPAPAALKVPKKAGPKVVKVSKGTASWYGPGFFGNRTANGEVFRPGTFTAAHRTLPFGTKVRVTNLRNGKSTVVRINDRGPFHRSRLIDLAHGAAHHLGLVSSGLAPVRIEVLR